RYSAEGGATLTDGKFGGNNWGNGRWLGLLNKPVEVVLNLGQEVERQTVGFSSIEDKGSGVYFPDKVRISISDDGKKFDEIAFDYIYSQDIRYTTKANDRISVISLRPGPTSYRKEEVITHESPDNSVISFSDELEVDEPTHNVVST